MRIFLIITIFLSSLLTHAQETKSVSTYFSIYAGYQNLNGNWFKLGPEIYLVNSNKNIVDISLTANMGYFKKNFTVVPELGVGYLFNFENKKNSPNPYNSYINAPFYVARVTATPWSVAPELGITILGLIEAHAGYSFEFSEHKYTSLKGFKFGLAFHIPFELFTN